MFDKVLIANRGEIALRVHRAAKALGIETALTVSDPDRTSLPARLVDETVRLPGAEPGETYLDIDAVVEAAEQVGAEAVHPGYGFLSENRAFAAAVEAAGLAFVGPSAKAMERLGDKVRAKSIFADAGVPVVPGTEDPVEDVGEAADFAGEVGYPVLIKAASGGGGRGMRVVEDPDDLESSFDAARREAEGAFGDPSVYMEKLIVEPRHVEVQVVATGDDAVHLGERECSIQRRHQKLFEEAPSPVVDEETRRDLGRWACDGLVEARYSNAGTVEFLRDRDGAFYFMEVNTRIQVEHPVTEMITGTDLVKAQFEVAATGELPWSQEEIAFEGHALECRINAEDSYKGFLPSPGPIRHLVLPGGPGVRVDTHAFEGYEIPQAYDSLVAKLIVHGRDRTESLARARQALAEFTVKGFPTTIPFHRRLLRNGRMVDGDVHTGFLDEWWDQVTPDCDLAPKEVAALLGAMQHGRRRPRPQRSSPWREAALEEGLKEGGP